MDCSKTGKLILALRKEKGMTQKQLADSMNISDKAVSKWERGLGCPDVSLLNELSQVLNVSVERILLGALDPSDKEAVNMKKIRFYLCPNCGNVLSSTSEGELSCCGRRLSPLIPQKVDGAHSVTSQLVEDEYYITLNHPMTKEHYISFVACVNDDRVLMVKLYPEQSPALRIPPLSRGKLYLACNQHGLWVMDIKKGVIA